MSNERLAVLEEKVDSIKEDVLEIKDMIRENNLKTHTLEVTCAANHSNDNWKKKLIYLLLALLVGGGSGGAIINKAMADDPAPQKVEKVVNK